MTPTHCFGGRGSPRGLGLISIMTFLPLTEPTFIMSSTICLKTVVFVTTFCNNNLSQYGFERLYLIGSRAHGDPRSNSDHDFIAVIADTAPQAICTGRDLHIKLFVDLNHSRMHAGLGPIDLLITRAVDFDIDALVKGSFSYSAVTTGIRII